MPLKKHIPAKIAAVNPETGHHNLCNLLINFPSLFFVKKEAPLFDFHANPNPNCFLGGNIKEAMEKPLAEAQRAMEQSPAGYSLNDIACYIDKKVHF